VVGASRVLDQQLFTFKGDDTSNFTLEEAGILDNLAGEEAEATRKYCLALSCCFPGGLNGLKHLSEVSLVALRDL